MSSEIAIKVENLGKRYEIYEQPRDRLKQFIFPRLQSLLNQSPQKYFREFWALQNVSFEIKKGETVGIVGRNGSGKSTLLQMICGTVNPSNGSIQVNGRIAALLELGSGFNIEFTGRENVYLNGTLLGMTRREINNHFDDIVSFADIGNFIDQPVKTYSSGMALRLAFAVAINVNPDILIIDEALAVGDAAFQRKCLRKIEELCALGVTLLFVSHDSETVKKICNKAVYLSNGKLREIGNAKEICIEYERDLFGASSGKGNSPSGTDVAETTEGLMDPELLSNAEKTYGDERANIEDICLKSSKNQEINLLKPGMAAEISYRVVFKATASKPIFGMMITNREGISIFGTNTTGKAVSSCEYHSGDEVSVVFRLTNHLAPGVYYLTCGVHADDGQDGLIYLCRRMDVLIFKSLDQENQITGGCAQLYPTIETSTFRRAL